MFPNVHDIHFTLMNFFFKYTIVELASLISVLVGIIIHLLFFSVEKSQSYTHEKKKVKQNF